MITPFCYDYQYKTESLYDSQFLGGTRVTRGSNRLLNRIVNVVASFNLSMDMAGCNLKINIVGYVGLSIDFLLQLTIKSK